MSLQSPILDSETALCAGTKHVLKKKPNLDVSEPIFAEIRGRAGYAEPEKTCCNRLEDSQIFDFSHAQFDFNGPNI